NDSLDKTLNETQRESKVQDLNIDKVPKSDDQSVTTVVDLPVDIILTGSDPNDDPITFDIVSNPSHGKLNNMANIDTRSSRITYTPDPGYYGEDSFTVKPSWRILEGNAAVVSITINSVNHAPVANDIRFSV